MHVFYDDTQIQLENQYASRAILKLDSGVTIYRIHAQNNKKKKKKKAAIRFFIFVAFIKKKRIKIRKLETELIKNVVFAMFY